MSDLVKWLRTQLDEDERVAKAVEFPSWAEDSSFFADLLNPLPSQRRAYPGYVPMITAEDVAHIARHDPARVLAEVAAKRAIIDRHDPGHGLYCAECRRDLANSNLMARWPCWHMRVLAQPYANRPGYREEWKP